MRVVIQISTVLNTKSDPGDTRNRHPSGGWRWHSDHADRFALALWQLIPILIKHSGSEEIKGIQMVRCRLGSYLVLALEFMIVSDLVHSVLSHKLEDLYFLGVLVILRTMISYFLNKEIQEISESGGHA